MARLALGEKAQKAENGSADLGARVASELAEIVQVAEWVSETEEAEAPAWCYWVSFPGVRYYSDLEWPSSVGSAKRPRTGRTVG